MFSVIYLMLLLLCFALSQFLRSHVNYYLCRMHTIHKATNTWYEMQDLHVWTTETMPQVHHGVFLFLFLMFFCGQLVALSEMYIQVYELQR